MGNQFYGMMWLTKETGKTKYLGQKTVPGRKGADIMTRGEIWKDFFKKVIVPVLLTAFLFYWGTKIFTQNDVTNYFYVWLFCGVPFGIRRMFLWLIPINHGFSTTVGIFAVNIIAGGLIGCIVIVWQLLVAAWYIPLTIYRLVKE